MSSFCALSTNYENDGSNDNVLPTTNMSYFEVWLFCVSFPLLSFEDTLQYEKISLLQITFRSAQNQQSLQISSALRSLLIFIPFSHYLTRPVSTSTECIGGEGRRRKSRKRSSWSCHRWRPTTLVWSGPKTRMESCWRPTTKVKSTPRALKATLLTLTLDMRWEK